ncbi:hypothetical protein FBQ81_04430 [Chloroflexi bacterium CFX6]|nr:hypothetical protein [Chloroflexi bacterium CFX6]
MLDLIQLLRVPCVDPHFDISPDTSKLAFAWNKTGEWQIYEVELSPSPHGRGVRGEGAIRLTSGPGGKFNPRYSPDGSRLAYVLDADGSESYHLIVYDFTSQQHTDLTHNISHALQSNFCWSPDGSQLAFLSDEKGHFSAYVIPSNGGEPQLALDTGHPAWQVEWSPDGRHLAVCCEMRGQDYGVFIVNLENKEVTMLCHPERQRHLHRTQVQVRVSDNSEEILLPYGAQNDMINAHEPKWSLDGKRLAFHSDLHGWFDIGVYDLVAKEMEWVTKGKGDSQAPIFLETNSKLLDFQKQNSGFHTQIAYTQSKGTMNWIEAFRLRPAPLNARRYQIGQGIHSGIRLTSDLKRMVTAFSSPSKPPDLWMIDLESGKSIQLTNSLPEELMDVPPKASSRACGGDDPRRTELALLGGVEPGHGAFGE